MFQPKAAKIALLVVVVVLAIGVFYAYAQTPPVWLSLQADSVQRLASDRSQLVGNVVIVVQGIRLTADSAIVHNRLDLIELNDGRVRIELPPASPDSLIRLISPPRR